MAASPAALAVAKLNGNYAGPYTVGSRKCCYVTFTFQSEAAYEEDGVALANKLEPLFGIRRVGQMEFIRVQADDTANLEAPQARWDAAAQKVVLYSGGTTSDPAELADDVDLTALVIDAVCWSEGQQ